MSNLYQQHGHLMKSARLGAARKGLSWLGGKLTGSSSPTYKLRYPDNYSHPPVAAGRGLGWAGSKLKSVPGKLMSAPGKAWNTTFHGKYSPLAPGRRVGSAAVGIYGASALTPSIQPDANAVSALEAERGRLLAEQPPPPSPPSAAAAGATAGSHAAGEPTGESPAPTQDAPPKPGDSPAAPETEAEGGSNFNESLQRVLQYPGQKWESMTPNQRLGTGIVGGSLATAALYNMLRKRTPDEED